MKNIKTAYDSYHNLKKFYKSVPTSRYNKADKAYSIIFTFIAVLTITALGFRGYEISKYTANAVNNSNIDQKVFANVTPTIKVVEVEKKDYRAERLEKLLKDNESPLAEYADYIVEQSDLNAIDWTILVAISKMESDYCKATISKSHNCWGLGGSNFMYFDSYKDSIKFTAELLNKHYRMNMNTAIKSKYCPSSDGCNPQWANIVSDVQKLLAEGK